VKIIRWFLGNLILFLNFVFTPKSIKRSEADQSRINGEIRKLKLYQFKACPFCVKVRRAMKRLNLEIETREAKHEGTNRAELIAGGGKAQVPCLRIESDDGSVQWMYESKTIIEYLQKQFA
jgi:glutaredoxin